MILRLLFFIFLAFFSNAQIGLKISNFRPTGELGFVMKPSILVELGLMQPFEIDSRLRFSYALAYFDLKPRLYPFESYSVTTTNGNPYLFSNKLYYEKFTTFTINAAFDFAFISKKRFFTYFGFGLIGGFRNFELRATDSHEIVGMGVVIGLRPRCGLEFDLSKHLNLFISANRNMYLFADPQAYLAGNDYGIGVIYKF